MYLDLEDTEPRILGARLYTDDENVSLVFDSDKAPLEVAYSDIRYGEYLFPREIPPDFPLRQEIFKLLFDKKVVPFKKKASGKG